jgi:uncharacterized protein YdaU (DUF1376 family)
MDSPNRPWWPLYGRKFFASRRVLALSEPAALLYLWLLDLQWEEGLIPADPAEIEPLLPRHWFGEWASLWPMVEPFFPAVKGGRANPRMAEERSYAFELSEKASRAGRASGKARRKATMNARSAQNGTSVERPFSDRSTAVELRQDSTGQDKTAQDRTELSYESSIPASADASAGHLQEKKRARKPASGPHNDLIRTFERLWSHYRGTQYAVQAKDAVAASKLVERFGLEESELRAERMMRDESPFWLRAASLPTLLGQWNQFSIDEENLR